MWINQINTCSVMFLIPILVIRNRLSMFEQDLVKHSITKLPGQSGKYEEQKEEQN